MQFVGCVARNLQISDAYFLENGCPISDFARFSRILQQDISSLLKEYCYADFGAPGQSWSKAW